MSKKGVIMYYDLIEQLRYINEKDNREIIVAMMQYNKNGTEPNFDGMKKVAFKFIKTTIDKNNDEYNKKCEKNRENILKRWGTNEYERIRTNTNVTDIDIDIDKDINIKKEIEKKKRDGAVAPTLTGIFDYWNSKNVIKHKELNEQTEKAIKNALKEFGEEQIKTAIDRYSQVIKDTSYYFDTKWTLCEFLKQRNAMPDFLDNGSKWVNYTQRGGKKVLKQQEYTQQDYDGVFDTFRNMA